MSQPPRRSRLKRSPRCDAVHGAVCIEWYRSDMACQGMTVSYAVQGVCERGTQRLAQWVKDRRRSLSPVIRRSRLSDWYQSALRQSSQVMKNHAFRWASPSGGHQDAASPRKNIFPIRRKKALTWAGCRATLAPQVMNRAVFGPKRGWSSCLPPTPLRKGN